MFPVLAALPTGWLRLETSMPGCYKQLVGALTGLTARMSQDTSLVSRDVTSHQFSSVCVCAAFHMALSIYFNSGATRVPCRALVKDDGAKELVPAMQVGIKSSNKGRLPVETIGKRSVGRLTSR